jgi:predicted  nucleic acid-binding Zn-ribbon protein
MYSSTKNLAGSVKSYFDRPQNSESGLIKEGDLDSIRDQYKSIVSKLLIKSGKIESSKTLQAEFKTVGNKINELAEFISSSGYKEFQELIRTEILNNPEIFGLDKSFYELIVEFQVLLDKLPKAITIHSLLSQLTKALSNKSPNLASQILLNIDSLFPDIEVMKNLANRIQNEYRTYRINQNGTNQELVPISKNDFQVPEYGDYSEYAGTFRPEINIPTADYSKQIDYLREEFDKLNNQQDAIREQLHKGGWSQQQIQRLYKEIDNIEEQKKELDSMAQEVAYRKQPPLLQPPNESYKPLKPKPKEIEYATLEEENPKLGKKGRGRPKGSGISKPFKDKIDKTKGIIPDLPYVPFGRYLINKSRLNTDNILSLKRPSGGNIIDIPTYKISENLAKVFKQIVGGKILDFNDLNQLTKEEQIYLYKVAKLSNLADKLSIPTPSKSERDKEFHRFEVMKGEILSGNDNKELIRSFKALILKLSRDGTLPKTQTKELLNELLELGY